MIFERVASLDEVLQACPDHEFTKDIVRGRRRFGVWLADAVSVASIGAQLPREVSEIGIDRPNDGMGTIESLFERWMKWVSSGAPQAAEDAATHEHFLSVLRSGKTFERFPIVLDDRRQIHDGRHRLFAAFHFLKTDAGDRRFQIFWDRTQ